jgi:hypothetical protein
METAASNSTLKSRSEKQKGNNILEKKLFSKKIYLYNDLYAEEDA